MLSEKESKTIQRLAELNEDELVCRSEDPYSGVHTFNDYWAWTFEVYVDCGAWDYLEAAECHDFRLERDEMSRTFRMWGPTLEEEEKIWCLPGHCRKFGAANEVESAYLTFRESSSTNPKWEIGANGTIEDTVETITEEMLWYIPSIQPICRKMLVEESSVVSSNEPMRLKIHLSVKSKPSASRILR